MSGIVDLRKELKKSANPKKAKILRRFFKTGKGEYGEGDVFLGITVPQSRKIAVKFRSLKFADILQLLKSKIHEERLIALLILVDNFNTGDEKTSHFAKALRDKQKKIFDFYLKNRKYINNWDLVDLSADKIVGGYIFARQPRVSDDAQLHISEKQSLASASLSKSRLQSKHQPTFSSSESGLSRFNILLSLAKSKNIWERRISIIATYYFIKNNKFDSTLKIAKILLNDKHDLIQKAVGWMLREVGKRDIQDEIKFLNKHYKKMPRTMLRYAIEKLQEDLRIKYLEGKV